MPAPLDNQYGPSPKDKPPVWLFRIDMYAFWRWLKKCAKPKKKNA